MNSKKDDIILFSDKRHRETRRRQSIVSIDDTDYLMEMRSARRRSIVLMNNDDTGVSSSGSGPEGGVSPGWNQVWNNFNISPDNIRNILPLNSNINTNSNSNKNKNGVGFESEEEAILRNHPIPKLLPGKQQQDAETVNTADESDSSRRSSSKSSSSFSSASSNHAMATALPDEHQQQQQKQKEHPAWYNNLGALSRWEHRQEKAYHDTLDERNEATAIQTIQNQNRNQNNRFWQRRSGRDGLDFSRDVTLAARQDSIYALNDSVAQFTLVDDFDSNSNNTDDNENNNGYLQDTRAATNPKTKKCVLDLIA